MMNQGIFKSTIMDVYPAYTKKVILKQAVNEGLVINNKKSNETSLNFTGSIDVSQDETLDDKIGHMLDSDSILGMVEEYDYKKPYRHFCYFRIESFAQGKIQEMVDRDDLNVFDKKKLEPVDSFNKPTVYLLGELIFLKFSRELTDNTGNAIKYVLLAIIDKERRVLEIRFDRAGIAYKSSQNFYKDRISEVLSFLRDNISLQVSNIDFKAVVDYMKCKDDITFIAQRMRRNGTVAYLEARDEDEESIIPILGELSKLIEDKNELFEKNEDTRVIKGELKQFITAIQELSDLPAVKLRLDEPGIKFGITHSYKDTSYSLFTLYGELIGEEMMGSVKEYLIRCCEELRAAASPEPVSTEKV